MEKFRKAEDIYEIDDWRIMGQPGYLFQKVLHQIKFFPYSDDEYADHSHCEFCSDYFHLEDGLKKGYYEPESKSWICEECFQDFKDMFGWKLK